MKQCYWDFGRWSDLWRTWRPVGMDRPFRENPITLGVSLNHSHSHTYPQILHLVMLSLSGQPISRLSANSSPTLHCVSKSALTGFSTEAA